MREATASILTMAQRNVTVIQSPLGGMRVANWRCSTSFALCEQMLCDLLGHPTGTEVEASYAMSLYATNDPETLTGDTQLRCLLPGW